MADQTPAERVATLISRADQHDSSLTRIENAMTDGFLTLRDDLKEHAKSDEKNISEIRECTEDIRVILATQKSGMNAIEKVIGALGLVIISVMSALILWKLGAK